MFSNKELRSMIITLFFEQLLVMLVGIVDTFVVSSCGEAAVSGVSLVNQFNTIFIYLFTALASGGAIVVSQYIGNKDEKRTILSSSQLLMFSIVFSIILSILVLIFNKQLLGLYQNEQDKTDTLYRIIFHIRQQLSLLKLKECPEEEFRNIPFEIIEWIDMLEKVNNGDENGIRE